MKYYLLLIVLLLSSLMFAEPNYVPTTTMGEVFGADWCGGCTTAWQGIQVLHSTTNNSEFISPKLYTESGALSSPLIQERFDYYG
ncbi:MAG: hypothetical protein PHO32_06210, partial [Candidatus Cloacimonetes bacterium]|nr:hypothetical protein [Candidatus Cloacimonadota bacterium]